MKITDARIGMKVADKNGFPMVITGILANLWEIDNPLKGILYLDFEGNEGDVWEVDVKDVEPVFDGKMINYEEKSNFRCITPCPYGEKFGKYLIMVGSGICEECNYFRHNDTERRVVFCTKGEMNMKVYLQEKDKTFSYISKDDKSESYD